MKKILIIAISVALSFGISVSCFGTEGEDLMLIQANEETVENLGSGVEENINVENLEVLEDEEVLENEEENIEEEEEEAGESFWNEITISVFLLAVVVVILALNVAQKRK